MARARNIKPSFFNNDVLADIEPLGRLLFIGLWTICDYKGNLEFREKKIKASLLPYDNCSVIDIAINLEKSGFIQSYSNDGVTYINIVNFSKHQNPHKNERLKGSDTPDISDIESQLYDLKEGCIKSEKIAINPDKNGTNPADSLILIPDPLNPHPDSFEPCSAGDVIESEFDRFWLAGMTKQAKTKALTSFKKQFKEAQKKTKGISEQAFTDYLIGDIKKRIAANVFGFAAMHPTTYLNQQRWNDDIVSGQPEKEERAPWYEHESF